jgi:hypothetical protein
LKSGESGGRSSSRAPTASIASRTPVTLCAPRLSRMRGCPGCEVVQADCVASPQGWHQRLGPIGAEPLPRHGSVQEGGRAQPARAQSGDDGESCPVAVRKRDAAAFTARSPTIATGHAGCRAGLVEKHQPVWIQIELACKPVLARGSHILPVLLSRVCGPFWRVMAWRAKNRDRLLVLTFTFCSCKASRSSRRKI